MILLVRRKSYQSKIFPTKMTTFTSFPMSNIRFMITITIKEITNMKANHFLRFKLFWCIDKNKETEIKVWDYDLFFLSKQNYS